MTTWSTQTGQTLVLVWAASDGVYLASGMEQSGHIIATAVPGIATNERPALIQFEDALVLSFTGSDNKMHYAVSYDGQTFLPVSTWTYGGTPITPYIGGPALVQLGPRLYIAGTQQINQDLMLGFNVNVMNDLVSYGVVGGQLSIDTPALGVTPAGQLQLAFAGVDPTNYLTLQPDPENLPPGVVYSDECFGGPAIATTVNGYAAAFVNKQYNIVLLYGLENASASNVSRTVLQDTSSHAPAVATINGVTYVAWASTDQSLANGVINFADLGSMPLSGTCAVNQMLRQEAGAQTDDVAARLRVLRDATVAPEPSGRFLIALLDRHGDELARLSSSHPGLRHEAWNLLQRAESIAASEDREATFPGELIDAAHALLARVRPLASPTLRESVGQIDLLLAALRGRTLADGLASASRSAQA